MYLRHSTPPSLFDGADAISAGENIGNVDALDAAQARQASNLTLLGHWRAIQDDGITAPEFIAFLKPLADLDGITVSHFETGQSTTKNLTFVLNTEGGISVESNFVEL